MPSAIEGVCEQIISELQANSFDTEEIFAVHLAAEEAFLNALKHGNKMDADKEIRIDYSVDSERIEISVTDDGEGFNLSDVPDPRYGENLYETEGRGLFLMRSYMDEVRFSEGGNRVHMIKFRGKTRKKEAPGQAQAESMS
jgi:serine/threonine-protein kinase RsbW